MKEKLRKQSKHESTTVSIPTPLFKKVEERIKGTGFTSVANYVTYVLREIITEEEESQQPVTRQDEEKVKARLRALGYID